MSVFYYVFDYGVRSILFHCIVLYRVVMSAVADAGETRSYDSHNTRIITTMAHLTDITTACCGIIRIFLPFGRIVHANCSALEAYRQFGSLSLMPSGRLPLLLTFTSTL